MNLPLNPPPTSSAMDEETARAELYGLIATLFYAAPDEAFLGQLRVAVTQAPAAGGFLEEPWLEPRRSLARNRGPCVLSVRDHALLDRWR